LSVECFLPPLAQVTSQRNKAFFFGRSVPPFVRTLPPPCRCGVLPRAASFQPFLPSTPPPRAPFGSFELEFFLQPYVGGLWGGFFRKFLVLTTDLPNFPPTRPFFLGRVAGFRAGPLPDFFPGRSSVLFGRSKDNRAPGSCVALSEQGISPLALELLSL